MKLIIFILMLTTFLYPNESKLLHTVHTKHNVMDIKLNKDILFIATDGGEALIYDISKNKTLKTIKIDKIKTYFDTQNAKIFNIDKLNSKVLMLSEGDFGSKVLHIYSYSDDKLTSTSLENEAIKKALFIDENRVLLVSLSSEIYIYDLDKKEITETYKITTSALGDVELLSKNGLVVMGCESGKIYIFSIDEKKLLKTIDMHKDNIYDIEISKNKTIVSGSADKFVGIFVNDKKEHMKSSFLVYAVGVSADGKKGAFMSDIDSKITIFDTSALKTISKIDTKQSTISGIIFYKDDKIISFAYENDIKIWRY
ncbi:nitrate reductase accessory protein [Campylobacter blaseri]|uniref:Uncharacterized protein n=1 Tax=Campylobacter blaseri TaxID=2042961 RepID=A0A2P8R0Q0_9BACT|nr:hypothetical protein [Campylobacter blaseri]PSM52061.1 hypothetical protein CQ405_05745 [Campylobacter blaseri]PSM53846.1 hypothetical protein CRN67_05745 [Campylobacter blaseri]QKF85601.1 nitrate reductase accessory protein [Campylobacter blaseri]